MQESSNYYYIDDAMNVSDYQQHELKKYAIGESMPVCVALHCFSRIENADPKIIGSISVSSYMKKMRKHSAHKNVYMHTLIAANSNIATAFEALIDDINDKLAPDNVVCITSFIFTPINGVMRHKERVGT